MNFIIDIYKTYGTKIILTLVFLVGICFYYFSFDGYNFYDDLAYMKYAYQLLTNTFHLTSDNFCHRFGLIIPTMLFYKLFGLNDITTTLFVLICWIGSVYLCFKVFSSSSLSLMIAVILSGLDYYHLFFNNKVYPDMPVAFFTILGLYYLYQAMFISTSIIKNAFIIAVSLFAAFISKTTVIYILPFLLILFISNLINNKNLKLWKWIIGFGFSIFSVYFLCYYYLTGNLFYVFTSIENSQYFTHSTYLGKGYISLLSRLSIEPLIMFINCGMIIPIVFSMNSFKKIFLKTTWNISDFECFWMLASFSIILMFWLGSISFRFYQPMDLNPRMIILLVPPLAILAGYNFPSILISNYKLITLGIVFLFISILCYMFIHPFKSILYGFISVTFFVIYLIKNQTFKELVFVVSLFLILSIQPIYNIFKTKEFYFEQEKQLFETCVSHYANQEITIITDHRLERHWQYYFGFNPPKTWQVLSYDNLEKKKIKPTKLTFVLVNKGFSNLLNQHYNGNMNQVKLVCGVEDKVLFYSVNP